MSLLGVFLTNLILTFYRLNMIPMVVVITDTWLSNAINDLEIVPMGFKIIKTNWCSRGRGVAILLKDTLKFSVMDGIDGTEFCWAKINSFSPPIIVGSVYRPSDANLSFLKNLYSGLKPIVQKNKHVVIAEDFNLPNINKNWENLSFWITTVLILPRWLRNRSIKTCSKPLPHP